MRKIFPILFNMLKNGINGTKPCADKDVIENCLLLSMLYIARNTKPNGRFVYRNSANPEKKYSDKYYSSLRHAGTLYAMYSCEKFLNNTAIQNKRYIASEYFLNNYVKRISDDMYGVVSKPFEEAPVLLATSGGTGLGLIALSNLLPKNKVRLSTLKKMGNFLIFMQDSNGDFWPSYEFGTKQKSQLHSARYYPGEACLGLLYLYENDKDENWLETAKKGLLRLAEIGSHKSFDDMKFDHWGILAIQKLLSLPDTGLTTAQKNYLSVYVEKNANFAMEKQNMNTQTADYGSFSLSKSLCGCATILEGLVAAYDCVYSNVVKTRLLYSIKAGVEFLAEYQVKSGNFEGGIPANYKWDAVEAQNSDKEIRIDNVQHALSAWVTYKNLLSRL